jgi:hypothetical protein
MTAEFREPMVGDVLHAKHPTEYINPYTIAYFGAGYKTVKPVSYSICVTYVSNSYVFYNSVSIWASGRVVMESQRRMSLRDFFLDRRTGNLRMVTLLRQPTLQR